MNNDEVCMKPIGYAYTDSKEIPRHWSVSDVEGTIEINKKFLSGLRNIETGQKIIVLFHFHKSPAFADSNLIQKPPHKNREMGVFSICSPMRPNPIGLSIVDVVGIHENNIHVKGIDMLNGTPVIDIKPYKAHDYP